MHIYYIHGWFLVHTIQICALYMVVIIFVLYNVLGLKGLNILIDKLIVQLS